MMLGRSPKQEPPESVSTLTEQAPIPRSRAGHFAVLSSMTRVEEVKVRLEREKIFTKAGRDDEQAIQGSRRKLHLLTRTRDST